MQADIFQLQGPAVVESTVWTKGVRTDIPNKSSSKVRTVDKQSSQETFKIIEEYDDQCFWMEY